MAKFEKTRVPGIYVRSGSFYASVTSRGITRKVRAGKTIGEAQRLKRRLQVDRDKGIEIAALRERELFADYALEWVASYSGRGRQHVSERTRAEYERDLRKHVLPWFQSHADRPHPAEDDRRADRPPAARDRPGRRDDPACAGPGQGVPGRRCPTWRYRREPSHRLPRARAAEGDRA